jgi:hypothetical protein
MSWDNHEGHNIKELDPGDRLAAAAICYTCRCTLIQTLHPLDYIVLPPGAFITSMTTEYPKDGPVVVEEVPLVFEELQLDKSGVSIATVMEQVKR